MFMNRVCHRPGKESSVLSSLYEIFLILAEKSKNCLDVKVSLAFCYISVGLGGRVSKELHKVSTP